MGLQIIIRGMSNCLVNLEKEGFIFLNKETLEKIPENKSKGRVVLYFKVNRNSRSDDEIDLIARQYKVIFILVTGFSNSLINYYVVD